jgi:large subunit ribosomal protein L9
MKVLFIKGLAKAGKVGEIREVSDSYARNVLIKGGYAVEATPNLIKQYEAKIQSQKLRSEADEGLLRMILKTLDEKVVLIDVSKNKNEKGGLYKSLHRDDVAGAVSREVGSTVPAEVFEEVTIKSTGEYVVAVKFKNKSIGTVSVRVE